MPKKYILTMFQEFKNGIKKHSPEILTSIGIVGMITTTIMAVKATPTAVILIEKKKEEEKKESLTAKETVEIAWKCYIPASVTGITSIICLIGANAVSTKRNAAILTAYTLSESALQEYQEKVVENFGEKKNQLIKDQIAEDHIKKDPAENKEIIVTGNGTIRCYDMEFGRRFDSNIEDIKQSINKLNYRMNSEMYISLNDLYYEWNLPSVEQGDSIGWNINMGMIDPCFSSILDTDGVPCLAISFYNPPKYGYKDIYGV